MNTLFTVFANAFRKEPEQKVSRVRNNNGMYARKIAVKSWGQEVGAFYMTSRVGFVASGRGVNH